MKLFFYLYEQHFYQVKPELLSLTLSSWAFFLDFQINSKNATRTAIASPPRSTTNIPPTLLTSSAFAFDSVALRSDMHLPVPFHHLLYNSWTFPSSCRWRIASDSLSLSGDPTQKIHNLNFPIYTSIYKNDLQFTYIDVKIWCPLSFKGTSSKHS